MDQEPRSGTASPQSEKSGHNLSVPLVVFRESDECHTHRLMLLACINSFHSVLGCENKALRFGGLTRI